MQILKSFMGAGGLAGGGGGMEGRGGEGGRCRVGSGVACWRGIQELV